MRHSSSRVLLPLAAGWLLLAGCETYPKRVTPADSNPRLGYPAVGKIERFDPAMEQMFPSYTYIEKVAQGFEWAEGPVWWTEADCLLFSDVPRNVVYRWHEVSGLSVFLKRSGYTVPDARGGEPGSNGLTLDPRGRLVLAQHGDRRISVLDLDGRLKTLTAGYKFLRYNSPNDLVYRWNNDLYFTDPPYGLEGGNTDPKRELVFNGVFRRSKEGEVTLLTSDLTFPNGIAFSPDHHTLYVAVSDPDKPLIMAYDVEFEGGIKNERVFFDAKPLMAEGRKGLPDGLKTDLQGNVFATGPGGVLVISPQGKLLGILNTGGLVANCAWGNDGRVLYLTADDMLCRVRTWTQGQLPGPPSPRAAQ